MKKTISVHLGGRLFNIEEVAFNRLSKYLNTIRGYFTDRDSAEEILSDIELRIAELFEERINASKEVITEQDVEEIIEIMGQPEDYFDDEETDYDRTESHERKSNPKQVFRDPDNKVLAGVCGGLGAYFGIDPIILRALFIIVTIFYGSGVIVYLVLALIIPKAKTTAQKLQMRGEPVTVESISRKVNESFKNVKDEVKEFGEKNNINKENLKKAGRKIEESSQPFLNDFAKLLRVFVVVILKIIGAAILFAGLILIFLSLALGVGWEGFTVVDYSLLPEFDNLPFIISLLENVNNTLMFSIGLTLTLIIPGIMLLLIGLSLLFEYKKIPVWVSILIVIVWFLGISLMGASLSTVVNMTSATASFAEKAPTTLPTADTLYIDVLPSSIKNSEVSFGIKKGKFFWEKKIDNKSVSTFSRKIEFDIQPSESDTVWELNVRKKAQGKTYDEALNRAKQVEIKAYVDGDTLKLPVYDEINYNDRFLYGEISYLLKMPVGKAIFFSESSKEILGNIGILNPELSKTGKVWTMTRNGLICVNCK